MNRTNSLVTALSAAFARPTMAENANPKVEPGDAPTSRSR